MTGGPDFERAVRFAAAALLALGCPEQHTGYCPLYAQWSSDKLWMLDACNCGAAGDARKAARAAVDAAWSALHGPRLQSAEDRAALRRSRRSG